MSVNTLSLLNNECVYTMMHLADEFPGRLEPTGDSAAAVGQAAAELARHLGGWVQRTENRSATIMVPAEKLDAALAGLPADGRLTILAGYTPTIELREEMRRRGGVGRYWEA